MTQAAKKCQNCGTEITPEEILQRKAGLVKGVLLCPACVELKRRVALQARSTGVPQATAAPAPQEEEPISLVSEDEMPSAKSQIRSFAERSTLGGSHHDGQLKRQLGGPRDAASRIRTFHGKLTDAGLANMDDMINDWLDSNPNIWIKTVTSSIGMFEAKTKEPHIFICMFY